MRSLPRVLQEIFDTGIIFTPDNFETAWDATMTELEAAFAAGGFGSSTAASAYLGNGRLVTTADTNGAPVLPSSPSLTIKLPDGMQWVHQGTLYALDEDVIISGVTANFTGWGKLTPTVDPDDDTVTWSATWHASKPAAGSGILGKVVTDVDSVNSIDTTAAESDIIPTLALQQSRYLSMLARLDTLEAGGGGGGGGGLTYVGTGPWLPSPGDTRASRIVIEEMVAAALAQALAAISTGGLRPQALPMDNLRSLIDACLRGLGESNPPGPSRAHAATIVLGVRGDGSGDTENHIGDHTTTIDTDAGEIEP